MLNHSISRTLRLSLVVFVLLLVFPVTHVRGFSIDTYFWPSRQATVRLGTTISATSPYRQPILDAISSWNATSGFTFIIDPNSQNIIEVGYVGSGTDQGYGVAVPYYDYPTYKIFKFVIKISNNSSLFHFGAAPVPFDKRDIKSTVRHELGHIAGLWHSDDGTLMYEQGKPGVVNNVDTDTINGINYIYDTNYYSVLVQPNRQSRIMSPTGTRFASNLEAISYRGIWSFEPNYPKSIGGGFGSTTQQGASAEFWFNGDRVTYYYVLAPGRGKFDVYIDNTLVDTVNAYHPEVMFRVNKTWDAGWNGLHRLKIVNAENKKMSSDGFIVNIPTVMPNVYNYAYWNDNLTAYILYSNEGGSWSTDTQWPLTYNNSITWSNTLYDSFTVTCLCRYIDYVGTKAPGRGIAHTAFDGQKSWYLDMYANPNVWQFPIRYGNGTYGFHSLTVMVTQYKNSSSSGYKIDLDAFMIHP